MNQQFSQSSSNSPSRPASLQRLEAVFQSNKRFTIDYQQRATLTNDEIEAYTLAQKIMQHIAIRAPLEHASGHPGGPLSAFTFAYQLLHTRDAVIDAPLRMSAGHLSLLAYTLEYLSGTSDDQRLTSPEAIIKNFRIPAGLPGHCEAGIGSIPFGFGPLGKGLSNALGYALGKKLQHIDGVTDVLLGDGDCQEGQIIEAARLASTLKIDTLIAHIDFNDIQLSTMPTTVMAPNLANIFSACGWTVIEVEHGNDLASVKAAQELARTQAGNNAPIVVIYYTTMGDGVFAMEEASNKGNARYHGEPISAADAASMLQNLPSLEELCSAYEPYRQLLQQKFSCKSSNISTVPFSPIKLPAKSSGASRKDFGAVYVLELMKTNDHIVVLHADLAGSGGFTEIQKVFPERIFNVGAAEANMYMMAAGLRQSGMLPMTYTFAAFGTNEARANARLIDINSAHTYCGVFHDCTHTGLSVGEDGETHQERHYFNIPFDNTQVWCTADTNQAQAMANTGFEIIATTKQSVFAFFPRTNVAPLTNPDGTPIYTEEYSFTGNIDTIRGNDDYTDSLTIIATGPTVQTTCTVADALRNDPVQPLNIRVLNVSCIQPIDASAIVKAALETEHIITIEDHSTKTGLGAIVADILSTFMIPCSLRKIGVDTYYPSGTADDLYFMAGLDIDSVQDACLDEVRTEVRGGTDALACSLLRLRKYAPYTPYEEKLGSFILQLLHDKEYLAKLYAYWAKRSAAESDVPTAEQLLQQLQL